MLLGVLALVLAIVTVILVDRMAGTDDPRTNTGPTASDQATSGDTSSPDDGSDGGADGGSGGSDPPPANQTPAAPVGGAAATFVDQYFDTVPTDPDAGWRMLSPAYQAQTGRSTYDGFWGTVQTVDATNISRGPGGDSVEATVTYTYDDGRTVSERQRIYLVDSPSGLLIDGYDTI